MAGRRTGPRGETRRGLVSARSVRPPGRTPPCKVPQELLPAAALSEILLRAGFAEGQGGGTFRFAYSASYEASSPDKAKAWRWIPNTGEYLVLGQLSLVTTNQEGKPLDFAAISECSVRLEAWDRAFIAGEAASNIRANKGTGFEIACSKTGNFATAQPVSAYKLTRGDTAAYAVADFSSSQSSSLVVDSKGRITVTLHTPGGDIPGYQFFAIRPLAGSIRPGDDLILGVKLGYTSTKTHFLFWEKRSYNETDLGADDSKYLAVYDKKMLWRANLYIAETANDWNDQHPWNAPPASGVAAAGGNPSWWSDVWGYNEWNVAIDSKKNGVVELWDSTGVLVNSRAAITNIESCFPALYNSSNGKQVISFSPWRRWNGNDAVLNFSSVTYGWGSSDSPIEFERKLRLQKVQIDLEKANNKEYRKLVAGNDVPIQWDDYIFPVRRLEYTKGTQNANYDYSGIAPTNRAPEDKSVQHYFVMATGGHVSIPGLATFLDECSDQARNPPTNPLGSGWNTGDYNWDGSVSESEYTAGVDCSGFVWRSMKYTGNNYSFTDKFDSSSFNYDNVWSLIVDGSATDNKGSTKIDSLRFAVPGDYIVINGHIALVQSIDAGPEGFATQRNQIHLIQSVSGIGAANHFTYQVLNNTIWDVSQGLGSLWWKYNLRRPK